MRRIRNSTVERHGVFHKMNMSPLIILVALLSGCTGLKYVPEGKVLYTKSEVKLVPEGRVKAKGKIKELLYSNINPKPNTSIFGMRPGLWFYYVAGNPKKKGLRMFIKNKMGQAPVYMSDIDPDKTTDLLKGHLINNGYFKSRVVAESEVKGKTGKVKFTAYVPRPYRFRNVDTPTIDTLFTNIDSLKKDSYVKRGQRYNLERLQAEHERLEEALENIGYYFFDDKHLIYEADSTVGERQVDLKLMLEPGVPAKARRAYYVRNINLYPDFVLSIDTTTLRALDTVKVNGYNYMSRQNLFRPKVITDVISLKPGKIYRRIDREYTLSHLMTLGAFKFVNIKFIEVAGDSNALDANIYMTPFLKKSIRGEFQAVSKSNNFVGPGLSVTLTNRNALRGSERLELSLNSGYEVQFGQKTGNPLNSFEVSGQAKLVLPRFITPFKKNYPTKKYLPTTEVSLASTIQQRVGFYNLNSANLGFGYTWKENTLKNHELYPFDLSFVKLGNTSEEFNEMLDANPYLEQSFQDQFIPGARYIFTLNTQVNERFNEKFRERKFEPSHFFLTARADVSGNLIQLLKGSSFKREKNEAEDNTIFGSPYSQFSKGEVDFRYYFQMAESQKLVTRLNVGVGYAYGNSLTMPYIKQFAAGGSTSIRAFAARSLGPGTYNVREDTTLMDENQTLFIDQRGDVKIESNLEYRYDISKVIKTALFVDAGNIWLLNEDTTRVGGKFEKQDFISELAVGTGIGVRLDFNFFVLRFDLACPIRKPWLPEGERWVFDEINLGSSRWRRDNLILNIAIGYPF